MSGHRLTTPVPGRLCPRFRGPLTDPTAADDAGRRNRAAVLSRFSLDRFQTDWNRLLKEVL